MYSPHEWVYQQQQQLYWAQWAYQSEPHRLARQQLYHQQALQEQAQQAHSSGASTPGQAQQVRSASASSQGVPHSESSSSDSDSEPEELPERANAPAPASDSDSEPEDLPERANAPAPASDSDSDSQPEEPPQGMEPPEKREQFRRQGLPSRVLVDRFGDVYKHVSGRSLLHAKVALVIQERWQVLQQWRQSAGASTPGPGPFQRSGFTILLRALQDLVFNVLLDNWSREEGREWQVKIRESGDPHHMQRKQLLSHFRTYNFLTYGGQVWLKFLIALGEVPKTAVKATNTVVESRVQFKEHRWLTEDPSETGHARHSRRADRASTPGESAGAPTPGSAGAPTDSAGAPTPGGAVHPRMGRRQAAALRYQLMKDKKAADKWWENPVLCREFKQRQKDIDDKMDEADAASLALGFPFKDSHGRWQLVNPDSTRPLFEEALCIVLREIGLSAAEVDEITAKPPEPPVLRRPAGGGSGGQRWGSGGGGSGGGWGRGGGWGSGGGGSGGGWGGGSGRGWGSRWGGSSGSGAWR